MQQHRVAALLVYEQLPTLTTAIEVRPGAVEENGPADAEVALVVTTAMQVASSC
jgi:hypothetical protein